MTDQPRTTLPIKPLPRDTVTIEGTAVEVRGLSRSEALRLHIEYGEARADEAEDFILSCGAGVTMQEAHDWRNATDADTAGLLVDRIVGLSGMTEDGKDPKASTPKPSPKAA